MSTVPQEVEGAGVIALLTESLLEWLSFLVALGLAWAWRNTIGYVLVKLGESLPTIHYGFGSFSPGNWFIGIANSVTGYLTNFAANAEHQAALTLHQAGWVLREMALQIQNSVFAVEHALGWFKHVFVPTYVEGVTHLWRTATHAQTKISQYTVSRIVGLTRAVRAEIAHAVSVAVDDAITPLEREIAKHRKLIGATAGAIAGGLALPDGLTGVERELGDVWGYTKRHIRIHNLRLSRLEKILGAAGFAALMANALGLSSWRCITRGNLGRVSRALCGLPGNFLNDLLGLIADFFILDNICTVLPWLEAAAADIGVPLVTLLTDASAGLCGGSIGAPEPLQGAAVTVPPVYTGTLSFAV